VPAPTAEQAKVDLESATLQLVQDTYSRGIPEHDNPIWLNSGNIAAESIEGLQEYLNGFGDLSELAAPSCNEHFYLRASGAGSELICSISATHTDGDRLVHEVTWNETDEGFFVDYYKMTVYNTLLTIPSESGQSD